MKDTFRLYLQRVSAFLCILFFCLFAAIPGAHAEGRVMRLGVDSVPLMVTTGAGEVSFSIEVADEEQERQRGMMFRQSMPADRGMLFVFSGSSQRGFWMQNTPLALDLLFIGEDGLVRAIENGVPFSTASIAPDVQAQFVLELLAGTAQKTGIAIGDRLRHPRIDAVVEGVAPQ